MKDRSLANNITQSELAELAKSKDINLCKQVAQHPNSSPDILKELFKRFPVEVLNNPVLDLLLLENPNFYLELYYSNSSCLDRYELPLFYLESALNYDEYRFRLAVAKSEKTPLFILEKLILDSNILVRRAVAGNPNISDYIIQKIFEEENEKIFPVLATNKQLSSEYLEKLAEYRSDSINFGLAQNINTPQYILVKLSQSKSKEILWEIARNISTPSEVLTRLYQQDCKIHKELAGNSNLSIEIKKQLFEDGKQDVLYGLLWNRELEPIFLEKLASIAIEDNFNLTAIARIALHPNSGIELKNRMYAIFKQHFNPSPNYRYHNHKTLAYRLEIIRLGWTIEMGVKYLEQTYGEIHFAFLSHSQFIELWEYISQGNRIKRIERKVGK